MNSGKTSSAAKDIHDAALGAFLGACVGDASGATLEFKQTISPEGLAAALGMTGGGVWRTAPGQITDDGELAMCLALALSESKAFDLEKIATMYSKWVDSRPFDIGNTTRKALGASPIDKSISKGMTESARQHCRESKANGSLMRAVPLALWTSKLQSVHDIARVVSADCSLSHPHPAVVSADVAYILAIVHLLQNPGDREGAWQKVLAYSALPSCDTETKQWIQQIAEGKPEPFFPLSGFVKIAFVHAFLHLRSNSSYLTAITETLKGGGDTDTNACIVGGLIGAAVGAANIPEHMRTAVLKCDTSKGQPRPSWLSTTQLPKLVPQILSVAPAHL